MTIDGLNPKHLEWLVQERGLSPDVVRRMGIYSVRRSTTGEAEISEQGSILAFPSWRDGEKVACKYRAPGKKFWQEKGGRKQLWNRDALLDERLYDGRLPLVICEGEIDAMSAMEIIPTAVSVPDGAPPARDAEGNLIHVPEGAEDLDLANDLKFSFLLEDWDLLKKVQRIIVCCDSDEPGQRLTKELVRRLGKPRCFFVDLQGYKDLNEMLTAEGGMAVRDCLHEAKPYPISGVYKFSELPPEPPYDYASVPWPNLQDLIKPFAPALMVVSGPANHGKTAWTAQVVAHLVRRYRWPAAIASFEMPPLRVKRLIENAVASELQGGRIDAFQAAEDLVENHVVMIAPDPDSDEETSLEWLLERADAAVIRHGIKVLLIDPWNEIEHCRRRDESLTEYTGRALRSLRRWGMRMGVLVIVVAHPAKSAMNKDADELSLYDVSDSAHFANKADIGVIVARMGDNPQVDRVTGIFVRKVRFQPETGLLGQATLVFDDKDRLLH